MHKAITIIQLKLEGQLIRRRPEFHMESRMLLDKIEKGTQGYVHQILMPSLVQRGTCRSLT